MEAALREIAAIRRGCGRQGSPGKHAGNHAMFQSISKYHSI
jgi:hypothetical protein